MQSTRRILRRAVRTSCQAVETDEFRLLGERVLDLSPHGMMIAADDGAKVGDEVIVSFQAPGSDAWFDAEAEVARVIEGWRPGDPGYCLGLRFTKIALEARLALTDKLRGWPPPVPSRALRATA
ncbi:MAG: PilZ domain-containing protein [Deltaproteobacteria bacterium]|nr:PilZ domain-containing protein [Deltaproteobacteria bacterium]